MITLFAPPPADGNLTWRQRSVLDLVRAHGSRGIPSEQAGALAHAQSSKHGPEVRCRFCRDDGRSILAALRKRGLVKQRRLPAVAVSENGLQREAATQAGSNEWSVPGSNR